MELIIAAVKIIHVIVSLMLILVVLLQPGKSGDLGSIFGGGTSESIFGSSGAVPFLVKVTRGLAVLFFVTSLSLGYFAASGTSKSVVTDVPAPVTETAPADMNDGDVSTGTGAEEAPSGDAVEAPATNAEQPAQDTGDTAAPSGDGAQEQGQNP